MASKVKLIISQVPVAPIAPKPKRRGRPKSFQSPQHLEALIEQYFQDCDQNKRQPNKAGLALFLGCTHETINQYRSGTYDTPAGKFSEAIKEADLRIESHWAGLLSRAAPTGAIFYLKAAFHYKDTDPTPPGQQVVFILAPEIAAKYQIAAKPAPVDANADVQALPQADQTPAS